MNWEREVGLGRGREERTDIHGLKVWRGQAACVPGHIQDTGKSLPLQGNEGGGDLTPDLDKSLLTEEKGQSPQGGTNLSHQRPENTLPNIEIDRGLSHQLEEDPSLRHLGEDT